MSILSGAVKKQTLLPGVASAKPPAPTPTPVVKTTSTGTTNGIQNGSNTSITGLGSQSKSYLDNNYGSTDNYVNSQGSRYMDAQATNNTALMGKLENDAKRLGYSLPQYTPTAQVATQTNTQPSTSGKSEILGNLNDMNQATYDSGISNLDAQHASEVAALQKTYNDAIAAGQISVRDAQDQYTQQLQAIDQQRYANQENTNVLATQRGISNSQQMLGMVATDNAIASGQKNDNTMQRDKALNDIQTRINNLTLNKNLDLTNSQSQYDAAQRDLQATRDGSNAKGAYDLNVSDYTAARDLANQKDLLGVQQGYTQANMATQQGYQVANTETDFQNSLKSMTASEQSQSRLMQQQAGITLNQMAKQLNIDKAMASYVNVLDLQKMAKSFGYDMEKMKSSQAFDQLMQASQQKFQAGQAAADRAQSARNAALNAGPKDDGYALALQREMAKYTPGTPEYNLAQMAYKEELKRQAQDTANQANSTTATTDPNLLVNGSIPATWDEAFNNLQQQGATSDDIRAHYEAYKRYKALTGESVGAMGTQAPVPTSSKPSSTTSTIAGFK